ncbi:unnamed protein product [Brassicogethes aeneus]|uniref:HECT domain-containing protein n=1 Tax=Brassicogethes aeneus TaxID=1431903 RepID=A0A9P0ATU6_BRAAE|nr:unnamed protein product [Brassicogethes aeneus]
MERSIENIVSQILQSPELRSTLENTVRNIQNPRPSTTSLLNVSPSPRTFNSPAEILHPSLSVSQELHRAFPSIRPSTNSTPGSSRRGSKRKRNPEVYFCKDVILVKCPNEDKTLRGISKSYAFEKGYAVSNVEFNINWTFEETLAFIKMLFNKHLAEVDCEIMVPMGGRLVRPSLPPGKELDGRSLKSIFYQKTVYIRPSIALSGSDIEDEEEMDLPEPSNSEQDVMNDNITDDYDNLFKTDLELAIKNSLNEVNDKQEKTLKDIIQDLKDKINDDRITQINVYREDIFNCCLRAINRKSFNPFNKISCKFSDIEGRSEEAVDLGGPSREVFRLVIEYLQNSRLFFGDKKKSIQLDQESMEKGHYLGAGRLISLSLIHGGPVPHFFTESLFSLLTSGPADNVPNVDDLEEDIKKKVLKLNEIEDINVLQDYVTEEPIFAIAGCHFIKSMEEKQTVFRDIVQFYGFHRVRPALKQLKNGLETGNVLNLMKKYPEVFKKVMCGDKIELTADFMQNLFSVEFSEIGSSKRLIENRIISFWRDFILDCSGMYSKFYFSIVYI